MWNLYQSAYDPVPFVRNDSLLDYLMTAPWWQDKLSAPLIGPHVGRLRRNTEIESITYLVLDFDGVEPNEVLSRALQLGGFVFYTTYSNDPEHGVWKFRIAWELTEPVPKALWRGVLARVNALFPEMDPKCKDPARGFFAPSARGVGLRERFEGPPLDWRALPGATGATDAPQPAPTSPTRTRVPPRETLERVARAWTASRKASRADLGIRLAAALRGEACAAQGERDTILFELARALVSEFRDLEPEGTAKHFEQSIQRMAFDSPLPDRVMVDKLERALSYITDPTKGLPLQRTEEGIKCSRYNVATILSQHPAWQGRLAWDGLKLKALDKEWGPWTSECTTKLGTWLSEEFEIEPQRAELGKAVIVEAMGNEQHPIRQYLAALQWDGQSRIEQLFVHYFGGADSKINRIFGKRWLISAVARALNPGCKVDTMPILSGKQGARKSSGFRALCPDATWFSDTRLPLDNVTRSVEMIRGRWIYEIAELEAFRGKEDTTLKGWLSSQEDNVRIAYAEEAQSFPRQVVFVGTTNDSEFLHDETGNRRYWPVKVTRVNVEAIERDRDQLWAEARSWYECGEQWHLTEEEEALAAVVQDEAQEKDAWGDILASWIDQHPQEDYTIDELFFGALKRLSSDASMPEQRRFGKAMRTLGWGKGTHGVRGGRRCKVWVKL